MKKTPIQQVKDQFGDKAKLVAAIEKLASKELWLDRVNEAKGLARVSNAKLLRLHSILENTKKEFGSRDKLIGAILELENRIKDSGFKTRLEGYALPQLVDLHAAAGTRKKNAEGKAPTKTLEKKPTRSKKAKAKAKAAA